MKKILKILSLVLAINLFINSQSNACGWLWSCTPTYNTELAKIGNVLYESGKAMGYLALKDGQNLATTTVTNHPLLSIGVALAYGVLLKSNPNKTIKYSTFHVWYPAYYTWKKLRQEGKIKSLEKRLEDAVKIKTA